MRLHIYRFGLGWGYSVAYRDYSFTGWGATRAAALAAHTVAVYEVLRQVRRARSEVAA